LAPAKRKVLPTIRPHSNALCIAHAAQKAALPGADIIKSQLPESFPEKE
jgi:DhnA family fructose-bisphosphate aldolase class Ia